VCGWRLKDLPHSQYRGLSTHRFEPLHCGVMNAPGLRFHPLKGKPKRWAVSVDENFRVIFRFEDGHALEVDYDDYH